MPAAPVSLHRATDPMRPPVSDRPVVRVVHPSGSVSDHLPALERGLARLEAAGCRIRWDPARGADRWRNYFAGDDQRRAEEFCAALREPEVEVVWFARGGGGGSRIVDAVLASAATLAPRAVIGFSDATSLLNALSLHLGWVTYHGPVVASLGRASIECEPARVLGVLSGDVRSLRFPPSSRPDVRGTLRGGNLTVLCSLVGTPFLPRGRGSIWLLEDVQEPAYRLDRAFWQLRRAGRLNGARGVWIGDLGLPAPEQELVREMFREDAGAVPVLTGAPAGHAGRLEALPIGAHVVLRMSEGLVELHAPRRKA